ncbi:hypothetical protein [Marinibactrum halimedae]|uniref:DUF2846 domain-containing protein n=1 Tax=Marinibactrum halimedae TaxID=1444977 RepID=A0AA37WMS7_9GAMM|nr:hypothetical protein [Marinibactrum halimedae]MCD9460445.1 hypothetical protein [Marinibactrum halimedae]GLS27424.1 hypothetical protein GCM10007877_31430 [Marinibactrum halimedae]
MKFFRFFLFLYFLNIHFVYAGNQSDNQMAGKEVKQPQATLIVFRPDFTPPLVFKPTILINNLKAIVLPRSHYAKFDLIPGQYTVIADWKTGHGVSDSQFDVNLLPGETTFLTLDTTMSVPAVGNFSGSLYESNHVDLSDFRELKRRESGWYLSNPYLSGDSVLDYDKIIKDIQSSDYSVKRASARFIAENGIYVKPILDVLEQEILRHYTDDLDTRLKFDSIAWLCRALAQSGNQSYRPTLVRVSKEAGNSKLKKYAKKYLKKFL